MTVELDILNQNSAFLKYCGMTLIKGGIIDEDISDKIKQMKIIIRQLYSALRNGKIIHRIKKMI